jgi:hypothetical protein
MALGWQTAHHVRLDSGNVIDIVAHSSTRTYVIERKPEITNAKLYSAIGQVLCYRMEYDAAAIPTIAAYSSATN